MQQLAARFGATPARIVRPQIKASDACQLHGACTRLCPTGALRIVDLDRIRELRFDPAQCIDCGACAHACPESALRVEAPEWQPFESASLVLARRRVADCIRCGDRSPNLSMDGLCTHCAKSAELARAGFALFGHGAPARPAETGPP